MMTQNPMVECCRFQILKIGLAKTNLFRLSIIALASYMPEIVSTITDFARMSVYRCVEKT